MYAQYMCILSYVKLIWFNSIPYIYCSFEWGVDVCSVYVHSAICETDLVSWYSMELFSIGVGVHVFSVYVHYPICETYLV